jgi:predicted GNAT superfamily acetyltransferase
MIDDLNAGDESDRLMARWEISERGPVSRDEMIEIPSDAITIEIPEDIVEIRMLDTQKSITYRQDVRNKFQSAFQNGYSVIGFSNTHGYVLEKK